MAVEQAESEEWSRTDDLLALVAEGIFALLRIQLGEQAGDLPPMVIPRPGVESPAVNEQTRASRPSRAHATHNQILAKFGKPRRR